MTDIARAGRTEARAPVAASVVVPAHDEASVIDACLSSLGDDLRAGRLEVVVVCNGCSDDTAVRARHHEGVEVIELEQASKAAALRAGWDVASSFPRVVLDADVELSAGAVHALTAALRPVVDADRPDVMVATPRAVFDTAGRPWGVRAFFRVHERLPYLTQAPVGPGCFAVSAAGAKRLGPFPDLTADDLWVQRHFRRSERLTVEDATFTVRTPRALRYLLRVRVRAYRGMLELDRVLPADDDPGPPAPGRVRAVLQLVRSPSDVPEVALYAALNAVAMWKARRAVRRGTSAWERDDSSR